MNFLIWKTQVRNHMILFMSQYGYPWPGKPQRKINDGIMLLLPGLFKSLDRAGLIPRGFTYQQFYKVAFDKYQAAARG